MRLPPLPPVRDELEDARTFRAAIVGLAFLGAAAIVLGYIFRAAIT